ncbi:MAG TPA: FtsX-like permease family protein, partial [Solirubrobacteraceae bacterium]|nr:FtsX-like permease family protein [Solirubrobacteraceae bacterium]
FQANVSDPTTSVLPESIVGRLRGREDVVEATPLLLIVEGIESVPSAVVFGAQPTSFFSKALVVVRGSRPASWQTEVLLGDRLAGALRVPPGETLKVKGRPYRVAGIYHSGISFEDSGAVLGLAQAQALEARPGEETNVIVRLAPGAKAEATGRAIERSFPGTQAIDTPEQALRAGANGTLISKAILVIVAIAIIVGVIGVTNTMAMAIAERRTELGLLSTVGWSPLRVASLILGEGIAVSVIGAAAGLLVGVIGGDLLVRALGVSSYVSPSVTAWGLGRGLLVGVAIGVLGGIYPAWRVTRMAPLKALSGT